jgi:hypothetical protein
MLRLKSAPFKLADAELVPKAGACVTCDKRTGAQPELFADVDDDDTCTDSTCYAGKVEAHWQRSKAAAAAAGAKVVEKPAETKKIFPFQSDHISHEAGVVDLSSECYDDPKHRTYRQLLGKDVAPSAVVKAPSGRAVEVLEAGAVKKLLKEAGHAFAKKGGAGSSSSSSSGPSKAAAQKAKAAMAVHTKALELIIAAIVARVEKGALKAETLWRRLATWALEAAVNDQAATRRGFTGLGEEKKLLAGMKEPQLRGLVFELLMPYPFRPDDRELLATCTDLGVDAKGIVAGVRKAVENPNAPPPLATPAEKPKLAKPTKKKPSKAPKAKPGKRGSRR